MIININDEFLIKSLSNDIKGLAIQEINKLLPREKIEKMANERFNNIFFKDCTRILQDGRFYNSLSKHLAMQISDKIADEVLPHLNLDNITKCVVEKITEKLVFKLNND